ncbi:hypothetical protein MRX96_053235 [Rhipicephalus microplus]
MAPGDEVCGVSRTKTPPPPVAMVGSRCRELRRHVYQMRHRDVDSELSAWRTPPGRKTLALTQIKRAVAVLLAMSGNWGEGTVVYHQVVCSDHHPGADPATLNAAG